MAYDLRPNNNLQRLKEALKARIFRLVFVGYNQPDLLNEFLDAIKNSFLDRKLVIFSVKNLTYRQITDGLLDIEDGIVIIPDFEHIIHRHDIRVPFNQRRDKIGKQSYALICCMPLQELEKLPKTLPDWWSMRTLSLELEPITQGVEESSGFVTLETKKSRIEKKDKEVKRLQVEIKQISNQNKEGLLIAYFMRLLDLLYETNKSVEGRKTAEKVLKLLHSSKKGQQESLGITNWYLAEFLGEENKYTQAEGFVQKAKEYFHAIQDCFWQARLLELEIQFAEEPDVERVFSAAGKRIVELYEKAGAKVEQAQALISWANAVDSVIGVSEVLDEAFSKAFSLLKEAEAYEEWFYLLYRRLARCVSTVYSLGNSSFSFAPPKEVSLKFYCEEILFREYLDKVISFARQIEDNNLLFNCWSLYADFYMVSGEYDKALEMYDKMDELPGFSTNFERGIMYKNRFFLTEDLKQKEQWRRLAQQHFQREKKNRERGKKFAGVISVLDQLAQLSSSEEERMMYIEEAVNILKHHEAEILKGDVEWYKFNLSDFIKQSSQKKP